MRLTQALYKLNRYRYAKVGWLMLKKRKAPISKELTHVQKLGLPTIDATEFLKRAEEDVVPFEFDKDVTPGEPLFKKVVYDESHPLYRQEPRYLLEDDNVLIEGLTQANVLLNSVQIQEGLPKMIEDMMGTRSVPFQDTRVKRLIMYSNVYDASQQLLPKRKDPERPAWIFNREYGITAARKFHLTISQMLQVCDLAGGRAMISNRTHLQDAFCSTVLQKEGTTFQIQNTADILVTSSAPITPLAARTDGNAVKLPDIHPLKFTVSIPKKHFYHNESIYPLSKDHKCANPHTIFLHYDVQQVKNLYEEPVTDSQFLSRTLVKAFAVAASRAQQLYGEGVKQLPQPITLQVVHTDSKKFHFAVLQLNTLDLNGSASERNIYWMLPQTIDLFSECAYVKGRPVLDGYNSEVFQRILSFYYNGLP